MLLRPDDLVILVSLARDQHDVAGLRVADDPLDRCTAIASAGPGDVVLIAGKGHEDYQERNGVREHFSDVEVARSALGARRDA